MQHIVIALDDAEKRFGVSAHLFGAAGFTHMLLVEGDTHSDALDLHEFPDDQAYGYIVDGNLTVDGSINSQDEEAMSLLVTGNLSVGDIFAGGADTAVLGNLHATRFVIGRYNHGYLHVSGDLHAALLLYSDHDITWATFHGVGVDLFNRKADRIFDLSGDNLDPKVRDSSGDFDLWDLALRLRNGEDILVSSVA